MPLTISHPAASVPFSRLGLVLSALIIGSLTPDFPYYIPIFLQDGFSHSVNGLFLFCLPLGLASLGVFHFLIKYPILSLFPVAHQSRLYGIANSFSFWPLRRFLLIVISILFGGFTHIFWDSFTHPKGWMVQRLVFLKSPILITGSYSTPMYSLLQHISTIVGLGLLLYWYFTWFKQAKVSVVPANLVFSVSTKITILLIMGITSLVVAVLSGLMSIPVFQNSLYYRLFIGHIFIVSVSVFVLGLMLFSVIWYAKLLRDKYLISK